MSDHIELFRKNIASSKDLSSLHRFLVGSVGSPFRYDDLLRAQMVYSVSSFDKLMHDLIRIGMVKTYKQERPATNKFNAESISLLAHFALLQSTSQNPTDLSAPPPETLFEQEITRKLAHQSFQSPDKVADGLSLIWDEPKKWVKIAVKLNCSEEYAKTKLKLIADRRNSIVHESDWDMFLSAKKAISSTEVDDTTDFLLNCGIGISELVNLI